MTAERNFHSVGEVASDADVQLQQHKLEALARLSGGMAHDFNNILHVIKNATELLRRKVPEGDAEAARLLDMLKRNAGRGTRLTRELLAFSGRQSLEPVPVNASRLIADMQDRLREATGRGVSVDSTLGGGLWETNADPAELETAVLNLVLNARDAMAGRGKIVIETANRTVEETRAARARIAAGDYVTISVRDTGHGMTAETLGRAFDPYFTTKEPVAMTGLGLSHVYGFVRQTQGHIDIESAPGAGTTVTVYLPRLMRPSAGEAAAPAANALNVVALNAPPPPSMRSPRSMAGLRVLVVEDESLIGMLAQDLLEELGCRMVGLVSSLGKALDMAKSADLDFALLDVDIGGEPVYPVAAALQARGVSFVFMSGYGGLEGPWRGRRMIQKPFDVDQLKREIEYALGAA